MPEDEDSWQEFAKIYEKLIFATALKAGLKNVEAQEVVQETLISVAKKIAGFNYQPEKGSFKGWLMTITRRHLLRLAIASLAAGGVPVVHELVDTAAAPEVNTVSRYFLGYDPGFGEGKVAYTHCRLEPDGRVTVLDSWTEQPRSHL